jgi:hypothetical protein
VDCWRALSTLLVNCWTGLYNFTRTAGSSCSGGSISPCSILSTVCSQPYDLPLVPPARATRTRLSSDGFKPHCLTGDSSIELSTVCSVRQEHPRLAGVGTNGTEAVSVSTSSSQYLFNADSGSTQPLHSTTYSAAHDTGAHAHIKGI